MEINGNQRQSTHLLAGLLGGDAFKSTITLPITLPLGGGCSQLRVGSLSKLL